MPNPRPTTTSAAPISGTKAPNVRFVTVPMPAWCQAAHTTMPTATAAIAGTGPLTRKHALSPNRARLPVCADGRRRVSGLRREEVAPLAGVTVEYYTRLERDNTTSISNSVLDGIYV